MGGSIETANCCDYGFLAVPGWDAVTGLGSPNFQIIANLVCRVVFCGVMWCVMS